MCDSGPTFESVKDSGDRHDFGTGSVRDRRVGKGLFHLMPTMPIRRLAVHFENGAVKYGDRNWEKGQPLSSYIDSCFRHLLGVMDGKTDEDHEAAVLWNMACFMQTRQWIQDGTLKNVVNLPDGGTLVLNDMPTETEKVTPLQMKLDELSKCQDFSKCQDVRPSVSSCSSTVDLSLNLPPGYVPPASMPPSEKKICALSGKRGYISGPITGIEDGNVKAFHGMAEYLGEFRDMRLFDPTKHDTEIDTTMFEWEDYLKLDIPEVCKSDYVVVLEGWMKSRGAMFEVLTAMLLNIPVFSDYWVRDNLGSFAFDTWEEICEHAKYYRPRYFSQVLKAIQTRFNT